MDLRVVALGLPTSGKSIYLSALHHQIINNLAPGVVFNVPLNESKRLARVYDIACDPDADWPPPTAPNEKLHESRFTCTVIPRGRQPIKLFDFTYVDYAGEWLTEPGEGMSFDRALQEQVERADALLGIIDGRRLLEFMAGESTGRIYFHTRIRPVVEQMRSFPGPIHFVISKWDLLQDKYTLGELRSRLFESPDAPWLSELVKSRVRLEGFRRRPVGRVRLIPVSSVGDFAYLADDGRIKKDPEKRPAACNVEIPLVALIPDLSEMYLEHHEQLRRGKAEDGAGKPADRIKAAGETADSVVKDGSGGSGAKSAPPAPPAGAGGAGLFGGGLSLRTAIMVGVLIGVPIGKSVGWAGKRVAWATQRRINKRRGTDLRRVKNPESGSYYVMWHFADKLKEFEQEYPDSLLS